MSGIVRVVIFRNPYSPVQRQHFAAFVGIAQPRSPHHQIDAFAIVALLVLEAGRTLIGQLR